MAFALIRARIKQGAAPVTSPSAIPAPVNGWNTRDELDGMDILDAVQMDNFFPDSTGVMARTGYAEYATGMGTSHDVETLAEYRSDAVVKFLAACDGKIFDISSAGAVGAAIGSGFGNNRWQTTNFLSRMFLANGADTVQTY